MGGGGQKLAVGSWQLAVGSWQDKSRQDKSWKVAGGMGELVLCSNNGVLGAWSENVLCAEFLVFNRQSKGKCSSMPTFLFDCFVIKRLPQHQGQKSFGFHQTQFSTQDFHSVVS